MDVLFQQIDQLAERLNTADHKMIDPIEYGELRGQVASLQLQVSEFKSKQAQMDAKLDMVLDRLAEAKGGWRTLMLLGGAASTLGAAVSWVVTHWKG